MSANAERAPLLAKRPAHRPQLSSLSQLSGGASYSAANRPNPSRRKRRPTADKGPEDSLSDAEKTRILIVIGIMRFTEPISLLVIFPFVNQMIQELHIAKDQAHVGFYAGALESLLSLSQFLTVFFWGRVADKIGRKPVLCLGTLGVAISTLGFGFSKNFVTMVAFRCIGGFMNGNVGVAQSVLAEISSVDTQARTLSYLPLAYAFGSIVGPLLGGYLVHPARTFSSLENSSFFLKNPYFLPCAVASGISLVSFLIGVALLKETLPQKEEPESPDHTAEPEVPQADEAIEAAKRSRVWIVLGNFALIALLGTGLGTVLPLFSFTKTDLGGLSFTSSSIGILVSLSGALTMLIQFLAFPPLERRLGNVKLYRFAAAFFPLVFLGWPAIARLAKSQVLHDQYPTSGMWIAITVNLMLSAIANLTFSANMVNVSDLAPSRKALGTMNGLAQSAASFMRAIGPLSISSLFAYAAGKHELGGYLIWLVLFVVSLMAFGASFFIRDEGAEWREEESA